MRLVILISWWVVGSVSADPVSQAARKAGDAIRDVGQAGIAPVGHCPPDQFPEVRAAEVKVYLNCSDWEKVEPRFQAKSRRREVSFLEPAELRKRGILVRKRVEGGKAQVTVKFRPDAKDPRGCLAEQRFDRSWAGVKCEWDVLAGDGSTVSCSSCSLDADAEAPTARQEAFIRQALEGVAPASLGLKAPPPGEAREARKSELSDAGLRKDFDDAMLTEPSGDPAKLTLERWDSRSPSGCEVVELSTRVAAAQAEKARVQLIQFVEGKLGLQRAPAQQSKSGRAR
jgi:hypothetical protein